MSSVSNNTHSPQSEAYRKKEEARTEPPKTNETAQSSQARPTGDGFGGTPARGTQGSTASRVFSAILVADARIAQNSQRSQARTSSGRLLDVERAQSGGREVWTIRRSETSAGERTVEARGNSLLDLADDFLNRGDRRNGAAPETVRATIGKDSSGAQVAMVELWRSGSRGGELDGLIVRGSRGDANVPRQILDQIPRDRILNLFGPNATTFSQGTDRSGRNFTEISYTNQNDQRARIVFDQSGQLASWQTKIAPNTYRYDYGAGSANVDLPHNNITVSEGWTVQYTDNDRRAVATNPQGTVQEIYRKGSGGQYEKLMRMETMVDGNGQPTPFRLTTDARSGEQQVAYFDRPTGNLVQLGTPEQVREASQSTETRGFLGWLAGVNEGWNNAGENARAMVASDNPLVSSLGMLALGFQRAGEGATGVSNFIRESGSFWRERYEAIDRNPNSNWGDAALGATFRIGEALTRMGDGVILPATLWDPKAGDRRVEAGISLGFMGAGAVVNRGGAALYNSNPAFRSFVQALNRPLGQPRGTIPVSVLEPVIGRGGNVTWREVARTTATPVAPPPGAIVPRAPAAIVPSGAPPAAAGAIVPRPPAAIVPSSPPANAGSPTALIDDILASPARRPPAPINVAGQSYDVQGVQGGEALLQPASALPRFSSMNDLIGARARFAARDWTVDGMRGGQALFRAVDDPSVTASVSRADLLRANNPQRPVFELDGRRFKISAISDDTNTARLDPVSPGQSARVPLSRMPPFEARLASDPLGPPYSIRWDAGRGVLEASRKTAGGGLETRAIAESEILPRYTGVSHAELGNIQIDTARNMENLRSAQGLSNSGTNFTRVRAEGAPVIVDPRIGSLQTDMIQMGSSPELISRMTDEIQQLKGPLILKLNALNNIADDGSQSAVVDRFVRSLVEHTNKLDPLTGKPNTVQIVINPLQPPPAELLRQLQSNPRISISSPANFADGTAAVIHQKSAVSPSGGVISTGSIEGFVNKMKLDTMVRLPPDVARTYYDYESLVARNASPEARRGLLDQLAQRGVVVNDPQVDVPYVARAINGLINGAEQDLTMVISHLANPDTTRQLIQQAQRGVQVRVLTQKVDPTSQALIDQAKAANPGLPLQVATTSKKMPYFHTNVIIADNQQAYVGTAYAWTNQLRNVAPDGRSFENGVVLNGANVATIRGQLETLIDTYTPQGSSPRLPPQN